MVDASTLANILLGILLSITAFFLKKTWDRMESFDGRILELEKERERRDGAEDAERRIAERRQHHGHQ